MNKLFSFYAARYGRRDIMLFLVFIAALAMIAVVMRHQFGYAYGLGNIRHKEVQCWILWNAFYVLITAFNGYDTIGRSYETILLPCSLTTKFFGTVARIFIVVPLISYGLMFVCDMLFVRFFGASMRTVDAATSLWSSLTYSGPILHRLPVMSYYLVLLCSVALLLKTFSRRQLPYAVVAALVLVSVFIFYGPHYEYAAFNYPFVAGKVGYACHGTIVSEIISWTSLGVRAQRAVSYLFLCGLPLALVCLSYFRFKEKELK